MSESKKLADAERLLGIEALRFITAFAMPIWHYSHFAEHNPIVFVKESQPFYGLFSVFYNYGFWGVQVFWCISGFIFFWKYSAALSTKAIGGKEFFILRFSRLYPLHFATLLLVAAGQFLYLKMSGAFFVYQGNDARHFLLQFFMASHWGLQKNYSFNGPAWSVSLEVLAYLCFFLVLRFVGKSIYVNIAVIALCFVLPKLTGISHSAVDCLIFFYIGCLSANVRQLIENKKCKAAIVGAAYLVVCLAPFAVWGLGIYEINNFIHTFLMLYTPVLLFCLSFMTSGGGAARVIGGASNLTYASYLLQFPVQLMIAALFWAIKTPVPIYSYVFFLSYIAIVFIFSYFVHRYFEVPVQDKIRRRFL